MNYLEAWDRFGSVTYAKLPEYVKKVAHQCVLDWYGCAVAGSRELLAAATTGSRHMKRTPMSACPRPIWRRRVKS